MKDKYENKSMSSPRNKVFFPHLGENVEAEDIHEAQKKLNKSKKDDKKSVK